ncbi:pilus assembly protein [Salmonella enterica subsp. enterica serovar Bredeney]
MRNQIIEYLSCKGGGYTASVADALKTTDYQVRYYLQQLQKEGRVKRSPEYRGKKTWWEIVHKD